jgi:hypothetical protein
MSEFISTCPKCRQQILCDTVYVGKRIACPLCLQEITMPEPPSPNRPTPVATAPAASAPPTPKVPVPAPRNLPVVALAIGAVVLVLATVAIVLVLQKSRSVAVTTPAVTPAAMPAAAPVAVPIPAPAVTPVATPAPAAAVAPPPVQKAPATPVANTAPDECRALWTFDQDSGTTAIDATGNGYNLTLVGDQANWSKNSKVGAAALSLAQSSYAQTAGPVVNTTHSFTVAAWVNLAVIDKVHSQTVVSIDGNEVSAFYLQMNRGAGNRFVFNRMDADDKSATRAMAKAPFAVATNTWYHLAGVYDADAKTLSLFVNGKLEDTVPYVSAWPASGKTAIGRGLFGKAKGDFLTGTIDDVRFYAGALTAPEIRILASK